MESLFASSSCLRGRDLLLPVVFVLVGGVHEFE